ncbi:MAG: hypothetical protein LBF97_00140 [Elusimicrobiota bacterium]|jgi:hypothetical protein|nr:hypothetical protein [Elusimicrobiota bacterium]
MMIQENILDPKQVDLSPDIFIPGKKIMKSKVKDYLIDTIFKWLKLQGYEKEIVKSMHLIGSSAGAHYLNTSDMDVSIETSIPIETIKKIWKLLPNGNKLPGTEHPINYYLTPDQKDIKETTAAYNILDDKWAKEEKDDEVFPIDYAYEVARFFISGFNARINEYEIDSKELEYLKEIKPKDIGKNEEEINILINQKQREILSDLDSINIGHQILKSFRKIPFEDKKTDTLLQIEIKQKSNTINNIVYKIITSKMGFEEIFEKYEDIRNKIMEQK